MKREELLEIAKPILFNTEMVRAILDGRKTQTRRVIRDAEKILNSPYRRTRTEDDPQVIDKFKPYKVGDILYVRETWAALSKTEGTVPQIYYRADEEWKETFSDFSWCIKWHPSIHMPKEAARIFLKVTDVRVERLQDIDDDGVVAEGLEVGAYFDDLWDSTIKKADRDKYGWDANPYVWVIEFEKLDIEAESGGRRSDGN